MATIDVRKNKQGEITGYRLRSCVGRDEQYRQVWRTCTIPRPEGLTPAKERKEISLLPFVLLTDKPVDFTKAPKTLVVL